MGIKDMPDGALDIIAATLTAIIGILGWVVRDGARKITRAMDRNVDATRDLIHSQAIRNEREDAKLDKLDAAVSHLVNQHGEDHKLCRLGNEDVVRVRMALRKCENKKTDRSG